MGKRIRQLLDEQRSMQPIYELERKVKKASGRHSKNYYTAEEIALAKAKAREWKKAWNLIEA